MQAADGSGQPRLVFEEFDVGRAFWSPDGEWLVIRRAGIVGSESAREAAGLSSQVPAGPGGGSNGLIPEGREIQSENSITTRLRIITPGYFRTLGISLVQGREFTDADIGGATRAMIVSNQFANIAWPGKDPIGRRVICCEGSLDNPMWKTVVGVVSFRITRIGKSTRSDCARLWARQNDRSRLSSHTVQGIRPVAAGRVHACPAGDAAGSGPCADTRLRSAFARVGAGVNPSPRIIGGPAKLRV